MRWPSAVNCGPSAASRAAAQAMRSRVRHIQPVSHVCAEFSRATGAYDIMKAMSFFRVLAASLLLVFTVWGQTTSSTLTGVIKDSTGAVIPAAKVQVVNEGSGVAVSAQSNT